MNKITVTTREQLNELYQDCALTFVGVICNDTNLNELSDWMKQYTALKREDAYIVSGRLMNETYGLTGDNAYRIGVDLVCFKLADMEHPFSLAIPRLRLYGHWFNDIVDNKVFREEEKAERAFREPDLR